MAVEVDFNAYTDQIWAYLMEVCGNEFGAAGMMGNLYAESNCTPYACEPTRPYDVCMTYIANVDDGTVTRYQFITYGCSPTGGSSGSTNNKGFGLCQWTSTNRKAGLYDSKGDNSIGDLGIQLAWLEHELTTSYTSVLSAMQNGTSVRGVSDVVLVRFESPQDQSEAVKRLRASYGQAYFDHYAGGGTSFYTSIEIEGNGAATATPNPAPSGQPVQIVATPRAPDTFLTWEVISGGITLDLPSIVAANSFTMGGTGVRLKALFTGEPPTPPTPGEPLKQTRKRMPIWEYPVFRIRR